ncbi:MAG TPA: HEAT repeat domain-containing protein [Pirellulales bacterium]|nr:HEAT repeat domain-containing protein [Pirellulales bacterium]
MPGSISKLLLLLKPKRRWAQFSLGTILLAVTLLCVWLGDYVSEVRKLERQLSDVDEEVRERAAERLGYMGSDARSATKSLLSLAKNDTSWPVRERAVWALSRVSGRADLLVPLLSDNEMAVKLAAAEGMLWLGEDPAKLVETILEIAFSPGTDAILEAMPPVPAATIIPALLDSLWTEEEANRNHRNDPATEALSHVALPAATVVPALIDRLDHEQPNVRVAAAEQILRLGASAKEAVPALRARLNDDDRTLAAACAAALCAIDPSDAAAHEVLKATLRSEDLAYHAAFFASALGPDAAIVLDDLVAFLCDSHRSGSWPSPTVSTLVEIGPPAVEALDRALRDAMRERDRIPLTPEGLRERIANIAWVSLPVVRRLSQRARRALNDKKDEENEQSAPDDSLSRSDRLAAVRLLEWAEAKVVAPAAPNRHWLIPTYLARFGREARPAVPTLVKALDYPDFRHASIGALSSIGPAAAPAIPKLLEIVNSDDDFLSPQALAALHNIAAPDDWGNEEFRQATAQIVALLNSGDRPSRINVFMSLEKTGVRDERARAQLWPFLKSDDRYSRVNAALVLAASRERAEQILPALIELAIDPHFRRNHEGLPPGDSYSPDMEAHLLASIASLGTAVVPGLIAASQDANPLVRRVAADALGRIGPRAEEAVPRLIELLDDEHMGDAAAEALGGIGPASRAAVPKLVEAIAAMRTPPNPSDYPEIENPDDYDWSGYDATSFEPFLNALAGIGQDARSAAAEVARIANFDDRLLRQAAVLTLARIDPTNPSLMPYMRRLLVEWERKSVTAELHETWLAGDPVEKLAEAIRELGQHADPLVPDLVRIVTAERLVNWEVRCYAAFALAGFPQHRQTAETCLECIVASGSFYSSGPINLADGLLQRIKGVPKSGIRPRVIQQVGP